MSRFTPADNEEKELMDEIDRGEWIPVSAEKDMLKLKVKATERGLPYQTLVTELIHEYVAKP